MPSEFNGDVRNLSPGPPRYLHIWNEYEEPPSHKPPPTNVPERPAPVELDAPMPSPTHNFPGLSFTTPLGTDEAGAGWPPDTNGDVGPVYFIQAVNDAWGIFDKATGTLTAGFTENQLWAAAASGTPCDSDNFGDPVAIHDGLADRWVLTELRFRHSTASNNPIAPFYQCIAVSKTSDPVAGGWHLYAVQMDVGTPGAPPSHTFADYPKFGFWTDCLYMGANGFNNDTGHSTRDPIFAAFDRTRAVRGIATDVDEQFDRIHRRPDHLRSVPCQLLGTRATSLPPAGTAEYFVDESTTAYQFDVRKFHKAPPARAVPIRRSMLPSPSARRATAIRPTRRARRRTSSRSRARRKNWTRSATKSCSACSIARSETPNRCGSSTRRAARASAATALAQPTRRRHSRSGRKST